MTVHKCQNKNQSKYFQICRNYWGFFPNALDTSKKNNNKRKQISFCLAIGLLSLYVESLLHLLCLKLQPFRDSILHIRNTT